MRDHKLKSYGGIHMEIYIVKHVYEFDGGFGDAIGVEDVLCGFTNKA